MNSIKEIITKADFKRLLILVLFASSLVLTVVFPHLLSIQELSQDGKQYFPYSLIEYYDMTNVTGPRIKEVLEGNLIISDTDLNEYKDGPSFLPPLASLIYYPFSFFTNSITLVVVISDAIFTFAYFLLFFTLFSLLSNKKYWLSVFFAFFTCLYPFWSIHLPPANFDVVKTVYDSVFVFSDNPVSHPLARRESFIPGLLPFLLSLIFLFLILVRESKLFFIAAGFFLALNAYTYPYHFLYIGASSFSLFLIMLVAKDWTRLKRLIITGVTAGVFLIPFAVNQIQLRLLPQYHDVIGRYGLEEGRTFRFDFIERYLILLFVGALVWYLGRKSRDRMQSYFSLALLMGAFLVLNINVFLGYTVQSDHWLNRDILWGMAVAYFLVANWIIDLIRERKPSWVKFVSMGCAILLMSTSLTVVKAHYQNVDEKYSRYTIDSARTEIFSWLNENTEPETVILSPSLVTNYFIPLYTHNNIFIPRGLNTLASDDEILERLLISHHLFGVDEDHFRTMFDPELESFRPSRSDLEGLEEHGVLYLYSVKYAPRHLGSYTKPSDNFFTLPKDEFEEFLTRYREFNCDNLCLGTYKADYVVVGPAEREIANVNFENITWLKKEYSNELYSVFKIVNDKI